MEEWNDVYDAQRRRTGKTHLRGTPWAPGEYGLVVCVWVYDGRGRLLLTRRAPEKSFPGTWENSGGCGKPRRRNEKRWKRSRLLCRRGKGSCGRRPALKPPPTALSCWTASETGIPFMISTA